MCYAYKAVGRIDEAIKMARSVPFISGAQETLLSRIYSGSQAYDAKQREILVLLQHLSNSLFSLQTELDSGDLAYTEEEYISLLNKRIALLQLFFENGDYGFYHIHLSTTYYERAAYYTKKEKTDKALEDLLLATEHSISFIESVDEENVSIVFRGMKKGSWATEESDNAASLLVKKLENPVFDIIRQTKEFEKIKNILSKYACKWEC